jgi:hypothetical protein
MCVVWTLSRTCPQPIHHRLLIIEACNAITERRITCTETLAQEDLLCGSATLHPVQCTFMHTCSCIAWLLETDDDDHVSLPALPRETAPGHAPCICYHMLAS